MIVSSNYNLSQLFISKTVTIYIKESKESFETKHFDIILPTLRDFMLNNDLRLAFDIVTTSRLNEIFHQDEMSSLSVLQMLLLHVGKFDKFRYLYDVCINQLSKIIPGFTANFNNAELKVNDITITDDI